VTRTFGAEAQAGFGIGSRMMQAGFMPAVAISFSAAAVVGQNYGSGQHARVRQVVRESAKLVIGFMLLLTLLCQVAPDALVRGFSQDPTVVAVGADYLRTISYNYVAAGLVFVVAGVFQGLGNTWPSLMASATRALVFGVPVVWLSRQPGFQMHTIWQMAVVAGTVQLVISLSLVLRELRLKAPHG
jgi:Na+-driven multidrug efflux pump